MRHQSRRLSLLACEAREENSAHFLLEDGTVPLIAERRELEREAAKKSTACFGIREVALIITKIKFEQQLWEHAKKTTEYF